MSKVTIPWMMQEGAACLVGGQHCTTTREGKRVEQVSTRGPRHKNRIPSLAGSIRRGGMLSEEGEEEKEGEGEERDRAGSRL